MTPEISQELLEEYLDSALPRDQHTQVEQAIARDPALRTRLQRLQAQRQLRAAVYASYEPAAAEARAMAQNMLEAFANESTAPIAGISFRTWSRRFAAVAAALVLVAGGSFFAGRMSVPPMPTQAKVEKVYEVVYPDVDGEIQAVSFNNLQDANDFIRNYQSRDAGLARSEENGETTFDPDHSGDL